MYGTGQSNVDACTLRSTPEATCTDTELMRFAMGMTAWSLIVLLSVAFIAVLMMVAMSLTRGDRGE